jgi:hypothetical protein
MAALRLPSPRREAGLRMATLLCPVDSFVTHKAAQNRDAADSPVAFQRAAALQAKEGS